MAKPPTLTPHPHEVGKTFITRSLWNTTATRKGRIFDFLNMKSNITNQTDTTSNHDGKATNTYTTPARGGQNLHHQITLEYHRNAERSEFDFLIMKSNITNQTDNNTKCKTRSLYGFHKPHTLLNA